MIALGGYQSGICFIIPLLSFVSRDFERDENKALVRHDNPVSFDARVQGTSSNRAIIGHSARAKRVDKCCCNVPNTTNWQQAGGNALIASSNACNNDIPGL